MGLIDDRFDKNVFVTSLDFRLQLGAPFVPLVVAVRARLLRDRNDLRLDVAASTWPSGSACSTAPLPARPT